MRCRTLLLIVLFMFTQNAISETISVPSDFNSIQQAVNEALPGDVISVSSGIFKEKVEIKKTIDLEGAGEDKTILQGLISISKADGVKVSRLRIEGSGEDAHFGVWCESSSVIITHSTILSFHHCIGSARSTLVVENNQLTKSLSAGILVGSTIDAKIKSNRITENLDVGILIALSGDKVLISDNVVADNRIGISCSQSKPKIRRNIIENNEIGIQTDNQDVPDVGTENDQGMNVIRNNKLHIVNLDRRHTLMAEGNYWGDPGGPKDTDFDGKVDYKPWLKSDPLISQVIDRRYSILSIWGKIKRQSD